VDVRKALRRFCGFFDGKWETINGRPPSPGGYASSPFLKVPFFRETRGGRYVLALDFYPQLRARTLNLLRCSESTESIGNAILRWNAVELAEAGLVMAMVRTNEEFRHELQYTEVLSKMPLITVEKIGESEPVPLKTGGNLPLAGIRALGMGHVIAGAAMGRDMALYGADVLNIWRPRDSEIEAFAWDVQVGMRSKILDDSKEDRARFNQLLKDADVFFANKRPGFLKKHGLDAETLCEQKPGLIHATVVLHGEKKPWSNRPGFDEIGAAVSGLFTIEGSPTRPKQPPIVPIADNVVGWLGTTGILAALRRRAIEGGSYRGGFADQNCALAALVRYLRQGLCEVDCRFDGRAHRDRSRSVHRGNAAWNVSGNDGPGHYVAHTGSLPDGPASARLKQTRMASGLEIAAYIQYEPACAVMLALSNLAASSGSVNRGNDPLILNLIGGTYVFPNRGSIL
jgi:hypothetical protein